MRGKLRGRGRLLAAASLLLGAMGCGLRAGEAQQATLVGDAHVASVQPTVNAGTLSNLDVGGGYTALVQFDLGVLPAGTTAAQITRATLKVYCNRADAGGAVSVQMVGSPWTEMGVTYAAQPALGAVVATSQVSAAGEFVTFDVTGAVQGWVSGAAANDGLALTAGAGTSVQFDSKENDETAHAAELEIALATGSSGSGVMGATGATGATGPAGATGAQGIQGVQGIAGPVGPTGPAGGSLSGSVGATGATGSAGATGATGATGTTGAQGPAGATGSPGLVYAGAYSSTVNYGMGDVVVWQGASWVSLAGSNVGQTPSLSPGYWGVLTQQGPQGLVGATGAAGPTGATGSVGPVGPAGQQGAQGLQGVAGQAGAQGIPGATGATGLQGPAGVQGVQGPVGLRFVGAYDSTVNYGLGDGVMWQGAGWVSVVANNHGNTPGLSPSAWVMFAASGSAGATGATGAMGATGANGLNGVSVVGATGATGPTGATGAAGLAYQGVYRSANGYFAGDVVTYAGSSWVSLVTGNYGQTPDLSPSYWSVLAAVGATGATGAQGIQGVAGVGLAGATGAMGPAGVQGVQGVTGPQGPAGAQGLTGAAGAVGAPGATGPQGVAGQAGAQGVQGVAGPTGAAGSTGATGAQGLVGMNFVGAYDATVNYGLGDGVLWQGAGWVSLIAGNHGNTPSASPGAWSMFAASGATGSTGATGAAGVAGANGLNGAVGATGPQGVQGPLGPGGANGATGATGPQGVAGIAGATGPMGPSGVAGATGPTGAQGVVGATGLAGATGVAGATGATGSAGLRWQGAYSSATNYGLGDVVSWQGASWVSLVAGNAGQEPDVSGAYWSLVAAQGVAGVQGPQGVAGAIGPVGPAGVPGSQGVQGVKGATGAQGPAGTQGLTGAAGAQGVQGVAGPQGVAGQAGAQGLQGVAGPTGAQGVQGPAGATGSTGASGATGSTGAVGIHFRSAWSSVANYAVNDAVAYAGSTYLALAANQNAEPDVRGQAWTVVAQAGGAGPTGAAGSSATVQVGTVTTLAAGAPATVTNTGTAQAAVLNFGIPQGATGAAGGAGGGGGAASGSFTAVYHAVSYNAAYYAVNSTNSGTADTENSAVTKGVLAWVPLGCTATQLSVYSEQSNTITVTLRTGTPGAMAASTLTCSVATGASCTATGSVVVAAGQFIDYEIDQASGTPAGVWTALQCQ